MASNALDMSCLCQRFGEEAQYTVPCMSDTTCDADMYNIVMAHLKTMLGGFREKGKANSQP